MPLIHTDFKREWIDSVLGIHTRNIWDFNTGWPRKNGTGYFLHYVDAIKLVSVYEETSPEKNGTKISNFGVASQNGIHSRLV